MSNLSSSPPLIPISKPSVQSLLLEIRFNGAALGVGTGFVAESGRGPVLITNRHNFTGRHQDTDQPLHPTGGLPNELGIYHNQLNKLGSWSFHIEPLYSSTGLPLWVEHPGLGGKADFVALPLTQLADVHLYPYSLGVGDPKILIAPADTVSVVGFPFGLTSGGALAVWATGFVASEPTVNYAGLPVFLIDCRARPGQSGSAVIAHRSGGMVTTEDGNASIFSGPVTRFLGIYSGRVNSGSDLGIVWKASAILELVQSIR
jgi:hypothetical protein